MAAAAAAAAVPAAYKDIDELMDLFNDALFPLNCIMRNKRGVLERFTRMPDGELCWYIKWDDDPDSMESAAEALGVSEASVADQMKAVCHSLTVEAFTLQSAKRATYEEPHRTFIRLNRLLSVDTRRMLARAHLEDVVDLPKCSLRLGGFILDYSQANGFWYRFTLNQQAARARANRVTSSLAPAVVGPWRRRRRLDEPPAAAAAATAEADASASVSVALGMEDTELPEPGILFSAAASSSVAAAAAAGEHSSKRTRSTEEIKVPMALCLLCQCEVGGDECWTCPEDPLHAACKECFEAALMHQVTKPRPRLPLKCVFNYCGVGQRCLHEIPEFELKKSFLCGPKQWRLYEDACIATVRSEALVSGTIVDIQCPECTVTWEVDKASGDNSIGIDLIMQCPMCRASFCTGCHKSSTNPVVQPDQGNDLITGMDIGETGISTAAASSSSAAADAASTSAATLATMELRHEACYSPQLHMTHHPGMFGSPGVPLTGRQLKNVVWSMEDRIRNAQPHCPKCKRASEKDEHCNLVACACGCEYCYVCSRHLALNGAGYFSSRAGAYSEGKQAAFMMYDTGLMVREDDVDLNIMYHQWEMSGIPARHQHNPTRPESTSRLCPHSLMSYWTRYRLPAYKDKTELQCIEVFMNERMIRALESVRTRLRDDQHFIQALEAFAHYNDPDIQLFYKSLIAQQTIKDTDTDTCAPEVQVSATPSTPFLPSLMYEFSHGREPVISMCGVETPMLPTRFFAYSNIMMFLHDPSEWRSRYDKVAEVRMRTTPPMWLQLSEEVYGPLSNYLVMIKETLNEFSAILSIHFGEDIKTQVERSFMRFQTNGYDTLQASFIGARYAAYVRFYVWDALRTCLLPQYRPLQRVPAHKILYERLVRVHATLTTELGALAQLMYKEQVWRSTHTSLGMTCIPAASSSAASASSASSATTVVERNTRDDQSLIDASMELSHRVLQPVLNFVPTIFGLTRRPAAASSSHAPVAAAASAAAAPAAAAPAAAAAASSFPTRQMTMIPVGLPLTELSPEDAMMTSLQARMDMLFHKSSFRTHATMLACVRDFVLPDGRAFPWPNAPQTLGSFINLLTTMSDDLDDLVLGISTTLAPRTLHNTANIAERVSRMFLGEHPGLVPHQRVLLAATFLHDLCVAVSMFITTCRLVMPINDRCRDLILKLERTYTRNLLMVTDGLRKLSDILPISPIV